MSEKIASLVGNRAADAANADAMACLQVWMERVRSGEITSVAIAGVGPGTIENGHSAYIDGALVGAVAMLQHDLCSKMSED